MRSKSHNSSIPPERRDYMCRKYLEARKAWWVSAEDFARAHGVDPDWFYKQLRARGISAGADPTNKGNKGPRPDYWRHGGLCTPRADANGIGTDD